MKLQQITSYQGSANTTFGENKIKFNNALPPKVTMMKAAIQGQLGEIAGGNNVIKISPHSIIKGAYIDQETLGAAPRTIPKYEYTNQIQIYARKQGKTLLDKVRNFFGTEKCIIRISDNSTMPNIIDTIKKALKDLNKI